jgi:serine/threonine protein phosphatase PrpC
MDPSLVLPSDLEPKAHAMANLRWRVVSAVAAGTSHERLDLPCQDAVAYQADEQYLLVALSDGAGTAERSQYGAQTAVQAALDSLAAAVDATSTEEQAGWQDTLYAAFAAARSAVESLAEIEEQPLRDYAATLILVVATADRLVVAQLGDGAVVAGESPDKLFLVNLAQRGEYANETFFLTQEDALEQVQVSVVEKAVNLLAVMSDGLTRLAMQLPAQEPYLPFFQPLFSFAAHAHEEEQAAGHLLEFLSSERVCDRTDDDKSLVLAVRMLDLEIEPDPEQTESESQTLTGGRMKG